MESAHIVNLAKIREGLYTPCTMRISDDTRTTTYACSRKAEPWRTKEITIHNEITRKTEHSRLTLRRVSSVVFHDKLLHIGE